VVTDNRKTPEGHRDFVREEVAKLKQVIEAAGQYAD